MSPLSLGSSPPRLRAVFADGVWRRPWFVIPLTTMACLWAWFAVRYGGASALVFLGSGLTAMGVGALKGRDWQEGAFLGLGLLYVGVLIELGLVLAQHSREQRAKRQ